MLKINVRGSDAGVTEPLTDDELSSLDRWLTSATNEFINSSLSNLSPTNSRKSATVSDIWALFSMRTHVDGGRSATKASTAAACSSLNAVVLNGDQRGPSDKHCIAAAPTAASSGKWAEPPSGPGAPSSTEAAAPSPSKAAAGVTKESDWDEVPASTERISCPSFTATFFSISRRPSSAMEDWQWHVDPSSHRRASCLWKNAG